MHNPISADRNHILERLSAADRTTLQAHGKKLSLARGTILHEAHGPIEQVYFPLSGMVSLLAVMTTGDAIETGIVGREGIVGGSIGGDGAISFGQAIVQISGTAWRIPAPQFLETFHASEDLRKLVNRYQSVILAQAQQSAACHALHSIEARLCRWLLQSRDTLGSDTIELTQEFLSHMMGVQRSSVSVSAHALQEAGLIRYARGKVQVIDADGLKDIACECYRAVQDEIEKAFPDQL